MELSFNDNKIESLQKMSNLYIELRGTNFHDLSDSIELWIYEKGDKDLLEYLESIKNTVANRLSNIIECKINN